MVAASWVTLAAGAAAMVLPSAPGFFGVYHSACRLVLERFGISAELAVALDAVFWRAFTGLDLLVMRSRHTSPGDLGEVAAR